jgi:hypothetical protein
MKNRFGTCVQGRMTRTFPRTLPGASSGLRITIATIIPCLLTPCLFAMFVVAGCASSQITAREQLATGKIPRPANIWVYDFAATPADLPAGSALAGHPDLDATPQTTEEISEGKKLGHEMATELVADINALGMPAEVATAETKPQLNDLVIRGTLLSIHEGSTLKRVSIGFGAGASELKTAVEGFQMTEHGLRKLGGGTVASSGGKTPGGAVGLAVLLATSNPVGLIVSSGVKIYGEASGKAKVEGRATQTAKEIAKVLKQRFQDQGWIE